MQATCVIIQNWYLLINAQPEILCVYPSILEKLNDPMDCTNAAMSVDVRARKTIILHSALYVPAVISFSHLIQNTWMNSTLLIAHYYGWIPYDWIPYRCTDVHSDPNVNAPLMPIARRLAFAIFVIWGRKVNSKYMHEEIWSIILHLEVEKELHHFGDFQCYSMLAVLGIQQMDLWKVLHWRFQRLVSWYSTNLDWDLPRSVVADTLILGPHPPIVRAHTNIEYCVLFKRFWRRSVVTFETL